MKREKSLTERVTVNFSKEDQKILDDARDLLSQDLSNFIRGAALEKARTVLNRIGAPSQHADA